jgi:hypothetical protein
VAWAWHRDDQRRAREELRARPALDPPYDLVADAVRLAVRAGGVSIPRGKDVLAAAERGGAVRGMRRNDLIRELGRLHRLEAWRLRREGQGGDALQLALDQALALGQTSLELDSGTSTGHEREEYVITLASRGDLRAAHEASRLLERGPAATLTEAELALMEGEDARVVELLAPIRGTCSLRECRVALAHARFRLGDPAWRDDLLAAREPWLHATNFEWHDLDVAEDVIRGRTWWPGWLAHPGR